MAFGRCVVDRIGYFDVRLGAGTRFKAAEDTDFVYRALTACVPVIYEPTFAVQHDHGRSAKREQYRLEYDYLVGLGALLAKSLLNGRSDLVRPFYWDVRSAVLAWRANRSQWRALISKTAFVSGAIRFLIQASWKKST